MGHDIAIIRLGLDELPANPTSRSIMDTAVRKWLDEYAERWSDPRNSYAALSPLASFKVAQNTVGDSVEDSRSKIVPFTNDYVEKTSTLRLEVTGDELENLRYGNLWELHEKGRFGADVTAMEITQLPKLRAPRAEVTEGKTITVYKVVDHRGFPIRGMEISYSTQARARAAAIEFMKEEAGCFELFVEAAIERENGTATLVKITRPEPEKATVTFRITTQKVKPRAKIAGYLVAFDYHH